MRKILKRLHSFFIEPRQGKLVTPPIKEILFTFNPDEKQKEQIREIFRELGILKIK